MADGPSQLSKSHYNLVATWVISQKMLNNSHRKSHDQPRPRMVSTIFCRTWYDKIILGGFIWREEGSRCRCKWYKICEGIFRHSLPMYFIVLRLVLFFATSLFRLSCDCLSVFYFNYSMEIKLPSWEEMNEWIQKNWRDVNDDGAAC
jgi:hypothetical protein